MIDVCDSFNVVYEQSNDLKSLFTCFRQGVAKRSDRLPYLIVNQIDDMESTSTNKGRIDVFLIQLSAFAVGKGEAASRAKSVAQAYHNRVISAPDDSRVEVHIRLLRPGKLFEDEEKDSVGHIVWHAMQEFEARVITLN